MLLSTLSAVARARNPCAPLTRGTPPERMQATKSRCSSSSGFASAGEISVNASLQLDPLSAVMMAFVTFVGFLIHLYSVGYMHGEPDRAYSRYFSYLNLFMFSMLTLVLGTISLSLLGSVGAALTVGLHRATALLSLLVLPLSMPVLIFGARTVSLVASGDGFAGGLYFLAAYAVLILSIAPFATAAALRISNE